MTNLKCFHCGLVNLRPIRDKESAALIINR